MVLYKGALLAKLSGTADFYPSLYRGGFYYLVEKKEVIT